MKRTTSVNPAHPILEWNWFFRYTRNL